jgi:transcriptional regulator with XRE-family HTH domain
MIDKDLDELRRLLREAVEGSRMSPRDLEDALEIGHGNLERLLNGKMDLRVRHLVALARVLKVPPADFLELGCASAAHSAEHRLIEWLGPARRRAEAGRLPSTPAELGGARPRRSAGRAGRPRGEGGQAVRKLPPPSENSLQRPGTASRLVSAGLEAEEGGSERLSVPGQKMGAVALGDPFPTRQASNV